MATAKVKNDKVSVEVILASLRKEAAPLFKKLSNVSVSSQSDYTKLTEQISFLKAIGKRAEAQRKGIVDPINGSIKKINELFKPFAQQIFHKEQMVKQELILYLEKQEKKSLQLEEKLASGKIKNVDTVLKGQAALQVIGGKSSAKKIATLKINDESQIPREYMLPWEQKILEALKEGKKVKGCELIMVKNIAIR